MTGERSLEGRRQAMVDHFEERAAIIEFDGCTSRAQAEGLALAELVRGMARQTGRVRQALGPALDRIRSGLS